MAATLGYELYDLRTKYRLLQKDVAADLGLHYSVVSMFENNMRPPNEEQLKMLAAYYETDYKALLKLFRKTYETSPCKPHRLPAKAYRTARERRDAKRAERRADILVPKLHEPDAG